MPKRSQVQFNCIYELWGETGRAARGGGVGLECDTNRSVSESIRVENDER